MLLVAFVLVAALSHPSINHTLNPFKRIVFVRTEIRMQRKPSSMVMFLTLDEHDVMILRKLSMVGKFKQ